MKKIKKPTKKTLARQIQAAEDRILKLEQEALIRHKEGKGLRSSVIGLEDRVANWSERVRQLEATVDECIAGGTVPFDDGQVPEPSATVTEQSQDN